MKEFKFTPNLKSLIARFIFYNYCQKLLFKRHINNSDGINICNKLTGHINKCFHENYLFR